MPFIFPYIRFIPAVSKSIQREKETAMEGGKCVLIIDDDLDFQLMISDVLGNRGFKVRSLLEGRAGIVHKIAKKSDIVLMDVELPGTNGIDLGRGLKSDPETEKIPIILISGHAAGEELLKPSCADAFIGKPFSLSGLLATIDGLLAT